MKPKKLSKRLTRILRSSNWLWQLILLGFFLYGLPQPLDAQYYDSPINRALGGAGNAITRGIFCVGQNPANLGLTAQYRTYVYLLGINGYVTNNFYSLESGAHFSGKDLTADGGALQREFLEKLPEGGYRLNSSVAYPLPLVNFSLGNKAFTTSLIQISDYYVSKPALDVIFGNWEKGTTYNLDLRCDAMTAVEYVYSIGIPFGKMSVGISLKYLQGLGYYGLDPAYSTGQIAVDTSDFVLYGNGSYYFRESSHGRGYGADLGVAFEDLNGWTLGFSVLNLGESVKWNTETALSKWLKDNGIDVLKMMGFQIKSFPVKNTDLKLDFEGESYFYNFRIDSLDADALFRSENTYQDHFSDTKLIKQDSSAFRVQVPLVLKVGAAKQLRKDLLTAIDFSMSFSDRLNLTKGWRTAVGFEYAYFPKMPLRVGLALGGISGWEFDIGSSVNLAALHIDWALGMNRGLWVHSMQGFDFALATYLVRGGKKK